MEKIKKRNPKLQRIKVKKTIRIGNRETAILKSLYHYRYLTADQIFTLHFPKGSRSYCNERLRFLFHKPHKFVNRLILPMEWGKGSPKFAYSITKRGADYLSEHGLYASVSPNKAFKTKNNTLDYRKHEIAINDFRIAVETAIKLKGWELTLWVSDFEFKNPTLNKIMQVYDPETGRQIPVAPDGFFALRIPQLQGEALFFLELDRGTMESKRFRYKKIRGFHLFGEVWRTLPPFQRYKNDPFTYRVLTVVDGGVDRTYNLKTNCAEKEFFDEEHEKRLRKSRRFYFTELSRVSPERVFDDDIWLVPFASRSKEERFALFDKIQ